MWRLLKVLADAGSESSLRARNGQRVSNLASRISVHFSWLNAWRFDTSSDDESRADTRLWTVVRVSNGLPRDVANRSEKQSCGRALGRRM